LKNHSLCILCVLVIFISLCARSGGPPVGCAVIFVWLLHAFSSARFSSSQLCSDFSSRILDPSASPRTSFSWFQRPPGIIFPVLGFCLAEFQVWPSVQLLPQQIRFPLAFSLAGAKSVRWEIYSRSRPNRLADFLACLGFTPGARHRFWPCAAVPTRPGLDSFVK
jgi:hypothetical protein